jgi:putative DNA primase/helicase
MSQITENLDQALHYAREWGWAVFPLHSIQSGVCTCGKQDCTSPGKHPVASLVPHGVSDASKDENQIRAWFGALGMPHANIGIATGSVSGLIVVDVDIDKGADTTCHQPF